MKITMNIPDMQTRPLSQKETRVLQKASELISDLESDAMDLKAMDGTERDSLGGLPGEVLFDDTRNYINKMHGRLSFDQATGNVSHMEVKTVMSPPEGAWNVIRGSSSIDEHTNDKGETLREYHIDEWATMGLSIPIPGFHHETVILNKTTGTLTYIDRGFAEGLLYN